VPLEPVEPPGVLPSIELDPPEPFSEPLPISEPPDPLSPIVPRPDLEPLGVGVPIAEPLPVESEPEPIDPLVPVPLPTDPALLPPVVPPLRAAHPAGLRVDRHRGRKQTRNGICK
jgi:hypothetical protein